jgi:hypothetical protein
MLLPTFEPENSAVTRAGFRKSSKNSLFPSGLVMCSKPKMLDIARLLLEAGAKPDREILLTAAQCGDSAFGRLLLDFGAHANSPVEGSSMATPLWQAAQTCPDLLWPLLQAGADPFISCGGLLPVDVATPESRVLLAREMQWLRSRLFVWARCRGVSDSTSLADVPEPCCRLVMEFLW